MPGDDIKFGIRLEVEGGRKAAGELRLPQREAERLARTLGGGRASALWWVAPTCGQSSTCPATSNWRSA